MSDKQSWYKDGLRFECQGSGKCCTSRGQMGFVYMTLEDRKRMAKSLKLSTGAFTKKYCSKTEGAWHLNDPKNSPDCIFLENNKCGVYEGRPTQCRTWPFWPETMNAKAWKKEVVDFCPGANKGRLYSSKEIDKILKEQIKSEQKLG
jgi:Fe-S-cluster containining protein